jgi:hypothetical protein
MRDMTKRTAPTLPILDLLGSGTAILCAVHCAANMLLVASLPVLGLHLLLSENTERVFIAASLALGLISLGAGWARHRHVAPAVLFVLAMLSLLVLRPRLEEGSVPELATVLVSAALLVIAHVRNGRLR